MHPTAFAVAALVGKILENLREMGLPLPSVLGDAPRPSTSTTWSAAERAGRP
jgi:hypothetical protein